MCLKYANGINERHKHLAKGVISVPKCNLFVSFPLSLSLSKNANLTKYKLQLIIIAKVCKGN